MTQQSDVFNDIQCGYLLKFNWIRIVLSFQLPLLYTCMIICLITNIQSCTILLEHKYWQTTCISEINKILFSIKGCTSAGILRTSVYSFVMFDPPLLWFLKTPISCINYSNEERLKMIFNDFSLWNETYILQIVKINTWCLDYFKTF